MKKTDEGEEEVKKCSKKTVGLEFHLPSIVSIRTTKSVQNKLKLRVSQPNMFF